MNILKSVSMKPEPYLVVFTKHKRVILRISNINKINVFNLEQNGNLNPYDSGVFL